LAFSVTVSILANASYYGIIGGELITASELLICAMFGAIISITITSSYSGIYFFHNWKRKLLESEKLKRESAQAEAKALKDQLDPHFLFNSLNTLAALVEENPKEAVQFIQRFSQVYRYVLQSQKNMLVSLDEELKFAQSYLFLLQARFAENLIVDLDISSDDLEKSLAPMSLQMLIENAVKHNIISREQPLRLWICSDGQWLTVHNSLQRKSFVEDSTKVGLQNIRHRYQLIAEKDILVEETETYFIVRLPLLTMSIKPESKLAVSL
jgi:LytS/YehU family sensor histidine kinase